jgi:hypothetical protein
MTWHRNTGKSPRDKSAEVAIVWANRRRSRFTYKVSQLVWTLRGQDFDIGWFAKADSVPSELPFEMEKAA